MSSRAGLPRRWTELMAWLITWIDDADWRRCLRVVVVLTALCTPPMAVALILLVLLHG
jgi:hypothetical protein